MAQCAAKTKEGNPCHISAGEGQKYCHVHRRQRMWRQIILSGAAAIALGLLGAISDITGVLSFFGIHPSVNNPTPRPTLTALPLTQPQVNHPISTPGATQYTIRFVARSIPGDGELHNVYVSLDDGAEEFLFTAGDQVDHTFYPAFSESIRVRVDLEPGTILHEELYVNGEMVASQDTDRNGLIYLVP